METKKTTMLGAVLAVAIIAFAGVGYATITGYEAKTINANNSLATVSIEMAQSGAGSYNGNFLTQMLFDSVNEGTSPSDDVTTYYIHNSGKLYVNGSTSAYTPTASVTDQTLGIGAALISTALSLNITPNGGDATVADLTVVVDSSFTPKTGLDYYMMISCAANGHVDCQKYSTDASNWTFSDVDIQVTAAAPSVEYTVQLFLVQTDGLEGDADTGFAITSTGDNAPKNTFTFTLNV